MPNIWTVILSAGIGFLGHLFLQTYFGMRSARIELVNDFIDDLLEIETLATEYWHEITALEPSDDKRKVCAAKLRGKLHAARCFRRSATKFLAEDMAKFDELDKELFRAATGGDFETSTARPDFARASRVMTTCAELRSLLRLSRRKAYWSR